MAGRKLERSIRPKFKVIQLAPILAILALTSWAFASPVGSSPDDDFHLASIWCARGDRPNECRALPDETKRAVPEALEKSVCFAFNPKQSAACQGTIFDVGQKRMVSTARGNFDNSYPPLYYLAMNLFVSSNIEFSVVLMRIVNILLLIGLTTLLYLLLPANRRSPLVWGLTMTLVPLGMFLIASNNPSSWAIISAGTLWVALVGYFESTGLKKLGLGIIATLSTVIGAGARADSAVFALVAIGAVVLLTARLNRRWILSAVLPFAMAVMAAGFYFSTQQSRAAVFGLPGYADRGQAHGWPEMLVKNLSFAPSLWAGVFGHSGLGWMDTGMPAVVWVGGFGCFAALMFTGLVSLSTRKLLAISTILSALWLFPTYISMRTGTIAGAGIQPRYILPVMIVLGGVVLFQIGRVTLTLSKAQVVTLVSALSIANAIALHVNIRRYVTASDVGSWNLNTSIAWWWPIPVSPMVVWAVGSISFAAFLVIMAMGTTLTRPAHMPHLEAAVGDSSSQPPSGRVISAGR